MDQYKFVTKNPLQCSGCEKKYLEGESCFASLREEEDGILVKESHCSACWPTQKDEKGPFLCLWKKHIQLKESVRPEFDREFALNLFLSLQNHSDPKQQKLRYLLALILTRKKILKWKTILFRDGVERLILTMGSKAKGEKEIALAIPTMDEEELEVLKDELIQHLTFKE